jgi:hypothetical protein
MACVTAIASRFECEEEPVRFIDNGPRQIQKFVADHREPSSPSRSLEQLRSDLNLKIAQSPAESRLTDIEGFRCAAKAPMLRGHDRPFQIVKLGSQFDYHRNNNDGDVFPAGEKRESQALPPCSAGSPTETRGICDAAYDNPIR